jgi:hypothetical protein
LEILKSRAPILQGSPTWRSWHSGVAGDAAVLLDEIRVAEGQQRQQLLGTATRSTTAQRW